MSDTFYSASSVEDLSEFPAIRPGEKVCTECNLAHVGECF